MLTKKCRGACGLDLEASEVNFSKDSSKAGGLRNVCRTCDASRRKSARGGQADHVQPAQQGAPNKWPSVAAFDASLRCNWCPKPATHRAAVRLSDDVERPEFEENGRKYGMAYWGCAACIAKESNRLEILEVTDDELRRVEEATETTEDEVFEQLVELGYEPAEIAEMTPGQAWKIVRDAAKEKRAALARERRFNSDFAALKPEDFADEFATGIANKRGSRAAQTSADAAREKRQEFNESMGQFATDLRDAAEVAHVTGSIADNMPAKNASYIRDLAEAERRFGNRRWARSIAISEAHEQLKREAMIHVVETYFKDKVEPVGYARLPRPEVPMKRTACVLLSDLHLGSELDSLDEPYPFKAVEEARRLEWILRQFVDFKPQYRDVTEALIIINGDIIEGLLLHDLRSGAPLAEQQAIFWKYFTAFIAYVAMAYKSVRVVCQPGNHGRNKLRHPGRATSSKWDSVEWTMYLALQSMCSELKNVTWEIPFRALSVVDLHGQILGVTHADTELKLGHPDTKAKENFAQLSKINSTLFYGVHFDGFAFGHYHTGRFQPGEPSILWNSALVPPNGHARTSGYGIGESCGQFIWESVPGHLFGDLRFIKVGPAQDKDERLGTLIKPFRFSMVEA